MDNHFHLLIETPNANLAAGMRELNGAHTRRFNFRHGRCGHVFQGRYGAGPIEKDSHYLEVCRYIVLNPVRAGLADRPQDWRWSHYAAMIDQTPAPPWLHLKGARGQFMNQISFEDFVADGLRMGLAAPDPAFASIDETAAAVEK